jgi:hypothetical protein
MKRVVVLGRGGAGKSSFARRLGSTTGIPVVELDKHFWPADPTPIRAIFIDGRTNHADNACHIVVEGEHRTPVPQRSRSQQDGAGPQANMTDIENAAAARDTESRTATGG